MRTDTSKEHSTWAEESARRKQTKEARRLRRAIALRLLIAPSQIELLEEQVPNTIRDDRFLFRTQFDDRELIITYLSPQRFYMSDYHDMPGWSLMGWNTRSATNTTCAMGRKLTHRQIRKTLENHRHELVNFDPVTVMELSSIMVAERR